jgi:hypothetical protein
VNAATLYIPGSGIAELAELNSAGETMATLVCGLTIEML